MSREILLHICCGPCATAVLDELRQDGYEVTGFFHNPSIHPWKELQRRLDALKEWASVKNLPVIYSTDYHPESNIRMLMEADNRCMACFSERMTATAFQARALGIQSFTTTLTISPYQNQKMILKAGLAAEELTEVKYLHRDFSKLYRKSITLSREAGMYRQPYCGCIFSERDRYMKITSPGQL